MNQIWLSFRHGKPPSIANSTITPVITPTFFDTSYKSICRWVHYIIRLLLGFTVCGQSIEFAGRLHHGHGTPRSLWAKLTFGGKDIVQQSVRVELFPCCHRMVNAPDPERLANPVSGFLALFGRVLYIIVYKLQQERKNNPRFWFNVDTTFKTDNNCSDRTTNTVPNQVHLDTGFCPSEGLYKV